MPALKISKHGQPHTLHPLDAEQATLHLGRHPRCDVSLEAEGVEPFHCRLVREADRWVVQDESGRGVSINGASASHASPLSPGDRFGVGPFEVELLETAAHPSGEAAAAGPASDAALGPALVDRTGGIDLDPVPPTRAHARSPLGLLRHNWPIAIGVLALAVAMAASVKPSPPPEAGSPLEPILVAVDQLDHAQIELADELSSDESAASPAAREAAGKLARLISRRDAASNALARLGPGLEVRDSERAEALAERLETLKTAFERMSFDLAARRQREACAEAARQADDDIAADRVEQALHAYEALSARCPGSSELAQKAAGARARLAEGLERSQRGRTRSSERERASSRQADTEVAIRRRAALGDWAGVLAACEDRGSARSAPHPESIAGLCATAAGELSGSRDLARDSIQRGLMQEGIGQRAEAIRLWLEALRLSPAFDDELHQRALYLLQDVGAFNAPPEQ